MHCPIPSEIVRVQVRVSPRSGVGVIQSLEKRGALRKYLHRSHSGLSSQHIQSSVIEISQRTYLNVLSESILSYPALWMSMTLPELL